MIIHAHNPGFGCYPGGLYGLRGLGQVDAEGAPILPQSGAAPNDAIGTDLGSQLGGQIAASGQYLPVQGIYQPIMGSSTQPQPTSGFNWSPVIAGFLGQGINLAGKVVAPTTTIQRGPNGQMLIETPASASSSTALLATAGGTGIASNWLVLAGLAVVAVIAFRAFSR